MKILLIAEHDNQQLKSIFSHTLSAALEFKGEIDVLIAGYHCQTVVDEVKQFSNVTHILLADHEVYQHQLAENITTLIVKLGQTYDVILAGASTFSKNCLPRAAALLDVQMISDVVQCVSNDTFIRPIYAGNALQTVQSNDAIKVLTVRATAFSKQTKSESRVVPVEPIATAINNDLSQFINQQLTVSTRPELTAAKIIVSGGRGVKSAENFKRIEQFADAIGAAIGASRAAVDAGFAPNDYQVGQTGKVVAPDLYIAIGISGAIQHLAGMKDSKVIVAINSDPDAPIFQIADYGIVADLFSVLPELQSALGKEVIE